MFNFIRDWILKWFCKKYANTVWIFFSNYIISDKQIDCLNYHLHHMKKKNDIQQYLSDWNYKQFSENLEKFFKFVKKNQKIFDQKMQQLSSRSELSRRKTVSSFQNAQLFSQFNQIFVNITAVDKFTHQNWFLLIFAQISSSLVFILTLQTLAIAEAQASALAAEICQLIKKHLLDKVNENSDNQLKTQTHQLAKKHLLNEISENSDNQLQRFNCKHFRSDQFKN